MENTVFVVLKSIIYLNIGYFDGKPFLHQHLCIEMRRFYPAKRHPVITRLI